MTRNKLMLAAVVSAAVAGGAWWYSQPAVSGASAAAAALDDAGGVVLVRTALPTRQDLPLTMPVFGDVVAGKVESQSFPQAGQLTRTAVVLGQTVHRGDLLAVMSSDPNALVTYEQAASALEFAQQELRRQQELLALQLSTQSQVDGAAKAAADARTALTAQARLNGAHGTVELKAPFDGVVSAIPVAQGDRVAAGATVVQLGRTETLKFLLEIEPARAGEVQPGMKVTLNAARDGAPAIAGSVFSVQNMVDPKTQMASAVVLLPAQAGLPVGAHVQGTIELARRQAWAVPRQAVLVDDQGAYLFQVAHDKARRVAVRKVLESDRVVGVDGALDAALPVVVLGNYELTDGAQLRRSAP